jgi:hypothetical protein
MLTAGSNEFPSEKKENFLLLIFHLYMQLSILLGKKCKWPPSIQDGGITTFHWFKVEDDPIKMEISFLARKTLIRTFFPLLWIVHSTFFFTLVLL